MRHLPRTFALLLILLSLPVLSLIAQDSEFTPSPNTYEDFYRCPVVAAYDGWIEDPLTMVVEPGEQFKRFKFDDPEIDQNAKVILTAQTLHVERDPADPSQDAFWIIEHYEELEMHAQAITLSYDEPLTYVSMRLGECNGFRPEGSEFVNIQPLMSSKDVFDITLRGDFPAHPEESDLFDEYLQIRGVWPGHSIFTPFNPEQEKLALVVSTLGGNGEEDNVFDVTEMGMDSAVLDCNEFDRCALKGVNLTDNGIGQIGFHWDGENSATFFNAADSGLVKKFAFRIVNNGKVRQA